MAHTSRIPRERHETHHQKMVHHEGRAGHGYKKLPLMLALHFVIMFAVMYTMVWSWSDVFLNLNQTYMTLMMVAPMGAVMLWLMRSMYPDRAKNIFIYALSGLVFALSLLFMRQQVAVGDRQFLRSMIPHHSGAILMCSRASLSDPELSELCQKIVASQTEEIAQMKRILERMNE
ncbi:MAG TPA: DUF305 domain-containing protein [Bdellovibrionales bacterium]|nr:DUF305 domain-containing protein [Bdellovibrionales bacterium]